VPGINDALARLANDPAFADLVRSTPTDALRGYDLTAADLARLEAAVGVRGAAPTLGAPGATAATAATASGRRPVPLLTAGVVVIAAGLAAGFLTAPAGGASVAADQASYRSCSDAAVTGSVLGALRRGDKVLVVGRSGPFVAIRDPRGQGQVWLDAAQVVTSGTGSLPEIACASASGLAVSTPIVDASGMSPTTATPTAAASPTASPAPSPSPAPAPAPAPSTSASTASTTSKRPTTTSASTSTRPPTTQPASSTTSAQPPLTLTVSASRTLFYSEGAVSCASYPQTVAITVTPSDAGRVTSTAVTWSGAGKSGTATKTGSTWTVGPLYSTHSGTATLTVTATITDRAGAARTASTTVAFRQISEECIG